MFSHGIFFSLLRARGNMFLTKVAGNCFVDFCVSSFFFQNPRFFCQKIIKSTSCHISFTFDIFQSFGEMEIQGRGDRTHSSLPGLLLPIDKQSRRLRSQDGAKGACFSFTYICIYTEEPIVGHRAVRVVDVVVAYLGQELRTLFKAKFNFTFLCISSHQ